MTIDPEVSAATVCDERGVPLAGRRRALAALRRAGRRDLAFGRIFEGHCNALELIARCGTPEQRARAAAEATANGLFGVWNTQDGDGVRIIRDGDAFVLRGAKTWCSGTGTVTRPIVTAAWPDGSSQMCVIPMDRVEVTIDPSTWRPLGMQHSDSYRVDFSGVELAADDLLGGPGDYERAPWFLGGAIRFVAVHTGGIERLFDETVAYLLEHHRDGDPMQTARVAEMRIALRSARNFVDLGADAWAVFDAKPSPRNADRIVAVADMARAAVERAALETIEHAVRSIGARGLLEPLPFGALVRDLQMYLRQPAPDAALMRVGRGAFDAAMVARTVATATSTGTVG